MRVEDLPLSRIYPREDIGRRKVDNARVEEIMESVGEVGLLSPISVRATKRHISGTLSDAWEIVAGHHRYEAFSRLTRETIPCQIIELDDLRAELAAIDENLMRAELTPAQEAAQTARRKEIYETLHPEVAHGGNQSAGGRFAPSRQNGDTADRFTTATAKATGKSERSIQRAAERGQKIGQDDLVKIQGTSLDKPGELDALAKMDQQQRAEVINLATRGKTVSARKPVAPAPDPINDIESNEKQVARLMSAWNAASREAREEFLSRIDRPIMDSNFA